MKLVKTSSEKIVEILKCIIEADSTKEIALITAAEELEFGEYEIFSGDKSIFTGILVSSLDHKEYRLERVKINKQQGVLANLLRDLECGTFTRSGSGKAILISPKDLFSISIKKNQPRSFRVNLNLLWKSWKSESWDVGSVIFEQLATTTPDSILKSFPAVHSTLSGWLVVESEIIENSKKWFKVKDKYREVTDFKGTLLLHRAAEVFNYETWSIGSEKADETLDLFIDLTNYTCTYSEWRPETRYNKGNFVLFDGILRRSQVEHTSKNEFEESYWETEENYYACEKESLFYSSFGRDLVVALNENVYDFLLKTYPLTVIDFIGTWEAWKDLEIGTTLEMNTETGPIKAEVTKFTKKMNCLLEKSKREVVVQCRMVGEHWRQNKQKDFEVVNINILNGVMTRSISINNPSEQQLQQEKVKGSSIALSINPFYTNQIKVQLR